MTRLRNVVVLAPLLALGCSSKDDAPAAPEVDASVDATSPEAGSDALDDGASSTDPVSIVVLGSSTAAAFGLPDADDGWVARYGVYLEETRPGSRLVNLAVPGFTTYEVLPTGTENPTDRPAVNHIRNVTTALDEDPQAIIVSLTSNDGALGFDLVETMANFHTLVDTAADAGVETWVTTTGPRNLTAAGIALQKATRDQILADFAGRSLDFWTPLAGPDDKPLPQYNSGDGIHPNVDGHTLLLEVVKAADVPAQLD